MTAAEGVSVTLHRGTKDELILYANPRRETMRLIRQEWDSRSFQDQFQRALESMYGFKCAVCQKSGNEAKRRLEPGQSVNFTQCQICDDFFICDRQKCRSAALMFHELRMPDEDEKEDSHEWSDHQISVMFHNFDESAEFFTNEALEAAAVGMTVTRVLSDMSVPWTMITSLFKSDSDMPSAETVTVALKEAIEYFGFVKLDLDDPLVFCASTFNRKYIEIALTHHPDYPQRGGSRERFILLSTYYGLLKSALQDPVVEQHAKEVARSGILW